MLTYVFFQINSSQLVGGVEYGDSPNSLSLSDSDSLTVLEASWSSPGLAPSSWGAAGGMACSSSFDRLPPHELRYWTMPAHHLFPAMAELLGPSVAPQWRRRNTTPRTRAFCLKAFAMDRAQSSCTRITRCHGR